MAAARWRRARDSGVGEDAVVVNLRPARRSDTDAVLDIFHIARATALSYLPILHTDAGDRAFFGAHIAHGATTVAIDRGRVVGFIVLDGAHIEHLYVEPDAQRRGIGSMLLQHAQVLCPDGLSLWVFARNDAAIAFYETHGFTIVQTTDGAANEEREPDARMTWPRPQRTAEGC